MTDPDYFTLVEFRDLPDCGGAAFTDAKILAAAAYFTSIVESELNTSLIARSYSETFDGLYLRTLTLTHPDVITISSVTADGVAVNTALISVNTSGSLRYRDGCSRWSGARVSNIVVTYTAGLFTVCPADVKDAVMWATRDRLQAQSDQNGVDVRRTSMTTDYGTTSYVLPGENRPTGYPDLDAVIASRKRSLGPAAG